MKKLVLICVAMAAVGALFLPMQDPEPITELTPARELAMKQHILQEDVAVTNALCRLQCKQALSTALQENSGKSMSMETALRALQREHPHMVYLRWQDAQNNKSEIKTVTVGELPMEVEEAAKPYLQAADNAANRSMSYESKAVHLDKEEYFVLHEPSPSGNGSITAVVHQDILDQVQIEQRKNLRLVPYPSDQRFEIHSVDSDTLSDVEVDHPEDNEGTSHYYRQEVVVRFTVDPTDAELQQMCQDVACVNYKKLGYTYVFESKSVTAKAMMDYFKDQWNPVYTEPHFMYMTNAVSELTDEDLYVPNDVLFNEYQWNLPTIDTLEGWNITRGSEKITVAVVDTGVDLDHPDLAGNLVGGYNVMNPEQQPDDDVGHGSHVAGVISATVDNVEGIAGMSWFNHVMPVKVLDETGAGSTYNVAQGIIWATDHGAKVINMSLGNYVDAEFLHDAIRYAYDRDVVLIAATGNDNTDKPGYPAAYPEVFAVSATDYRNQKAVFSNYGDYVDVVAPGENIASTYMQAQYAALSGTSMASPHVAALAAMIRSVNPALTNAEVIQLMRNSVTDLGPAGKDDVYGYGLIDVKKALESALQQQYSLLLLPRRVEHSVAELLNS